MKKYSIGEMSKLHKVSIDTLRFYDKIGLFKPKFVNENNRYRYYTADQFLKLERIKYLRKLNFNIEEIKEVIDYKNIQLVKNRLKEGRKRVEREMEELSLMKKRLDKTLETFEVLEDRRNYNVIKIKEFGDRYYISKELIDARDQDEVEVGLRDLMEYIGEEKGLYDSLCAYFVEKLTFDEDVYINHNKVAFIAEKNLLEEVDKTNVYLLPGGTYISLIYEDDYRRNYLYYREIKKELDRLGYEVAGDAFEIVHIDDSFGKENSSIIEIQIKVSKK